MNEAEQDETGREKWGSDLGRKVGWLVGAWDGEGYPKLGVVCRNTEGTEGARQEKRAQQSCII